MMREGDHVFPSSFDYVAARSVDEAVAAKREGGDDARFLAGGQSLIPMMKIAPRDTRRSSSTSTASPGSTRSSGSTATSGSARSCATPTSCASDLTFGAIASAAPWISDPLVRNRGTLCGSVAHCDPEGDWNSVLLATGADVVARGTNGERVDPDHRLRRRLLHATRSPTTRWSPRCASRCRRDASGGAYQKLERKVGDYATVAVAAHLELADDGTIAAAGLALTAVEPGEHRRSPRPRQLLVGQQPSDELFAEAGELAAQAVGAARRRARHRPSGSATSCACSPAVRSPPRPDAGRSD